MKRKITCLLTLLIAGILAPAGVWADTATDDQLTAATAQIEVGGQYIIYTEYNDTKYYLYMRSNGHFTTTITNATIFTFTAGTGTYAATSWYINNGSYKWTNPSGSENSPTITDYIVEKNNSSRSWESQVLYYNGTAFAVRATNEPGTKWGASRFWTIKTVSDYTNYYSESIPVSPTYTETDNDAQFIWKLQKVSDAMNNATKTYYIKSAKFYGGGNMYFQSAAGTNDALIRTSSTENAGTYAVIPVNGQTDMYYLFDTKSKLFVNAASDNTQGTAWTLSATTATPVYLNQQGYRVNTDDGSLQRMYRMASASTDTQYANAWGDGSGTEVKNYGYSGSTNGDQWHIIEAGNVGDLDITGITTNLTTFLASAADKSLNVKYTGSVTNYGTLCLPFAYTLPSGVDAYSNLSVSDSKVMGDKIASGSEVAANTPVLLKGTGTFDVSGTAASVSATYTSGILTGTYASYTTVEGDYVLQNQSGNYAF